MEGNLVWKLEIALRNGVDSITDFSQTINDRCVAMMKYIGCFFKLLLLLMSRFPGFFRVQIYSYGRIMWTPVFTWKTGCQIKLTHFPFDEQTCFIQFTNWVYGANEVNLTFGVPNSDYDLYMPNGAWDLISNTVKRRDDTFKGDNWTIILPIIEVELVLNRKPAFYMIHFVLPSLFMTVTTVLVFCVPPDAGEKVTFPIIRSS